jgi:hypothetical protein
MIMKKAEGLSDPGPFAKKMDGRAGNLMTFAVIY